MKKAMAAWIGLILLGAGPSVRFESEGVRVGEVLIQGAVLELRESGGGSVLVSGSVIEPLAAAVEVEAAPGRVLVLEPGVRAQRKEGGVVLSTHGRRWILVGGEVFEAPVTLVPEGEVWKVGGKTLEGALLRVKLQEQEADRNLEALQEAARKIREGVDRRRPESAAALRKPVQPRVRPRMRRVFGEDPFVASEAVDSPTLRFLPQISPGGF